MYLIIPEGFVEPLLGVENVLLLVILWIYRILMYSSLRLLVLINQHEFVVGSPWLLGVDALLYRLGLFEVLETALIILQ